MHTFESIFQKNFQAGMKYLLSMTRGLQINILSFYGKKWLKKSQFWSQFYKISQAGMPPDLPSMTRGLQTNVLSFNVKKGSKVHNF